MSTLAQAYVQILPTTKGIKNSLFSELGGPAGEAGEQAGTASGNKFLSALKYALPVAAVAGAMIGVTKAFASLVKSSLDAAGELEQNLGGSEAVFKEHAESLQRIAKESFSNMGTSTSDYLATANKIGALFQGAGYDIETSMNLSSQSMQRAADVASIMGIDIDSAMQSISGAAKGNFTMMDNLGVAMNDTAIKAYALEKGIQTAGKEMTQQEKIGIAMQMFLDKTAYAAGNYAKENDTLSGSLATAKAALTNFMSGAGDSKDVVDSILNAARVVIKNLKIIIPDLVKGLAEIAKGIIPEIPGILKEILPVIVTGLKDLLLEIVNILPEILDIIDQVLPQLVEAFVSLIDALVKSLPTIIPALIQGAVTLFTALVDALPKIIPSLIDGIIDTIMAVVDLLPTLMPQLIEASITLLMAIVEALPTIVKALVAELPKIITTIITVLLENLPLLIAGAIDLFMALIFAIPEIIMELVQAVPDIVVAIVQGIKDGFPKMLEKGKEMLGELWNGIQKKIPELWDKVVEFAQSIPGKIGKAFEEIWKIGEDLIRGLWDGIKDMGKWISDKIGEFCDNIFGGIKSFFGIASPSKEMAWVGEMLDRGLAQGIEDNTKPIMNAVDDITKMTTGAFENELAVNAALGITDETQATNKLDQVIDSIIALGDRITQMQIVLDSGGVVGGISGKMDDALGTNNTRALRGVATA